MIIVTGGAGFIGSAAVSYLNQKGVTDILIVDDLGDSDKWKNLVNKTFDDYLHKADFLKMISQDVSGENISAILHLGACSDTTERNAEYLMQNNYCYTRTLAEWALQKNIRFVYASSAATYGSGSLGFSDDDSLTLKLCPLNMYAYSKQAFDCWALHYGAAAKIAGLKFFNVYGPNEYHKADMASVIFKAYHQIINSGKIKLFKSYNKEYGDGEQVRDFVYIKDCLEVMWYLLEHQNINGIFNFGTGNARSWNDLAQAVFQALERPTSIEYIEMPESLRDRYQYYTEAEMGKLQASKCPLSFHSLEDGIRDYVCNYLNTDNPHL